MKKEIFEVDGFVTNDLNCFVSGEFPVCYFNFLPEKNGVVKDLTLAFCKGPMAISIMKKVQRGDAISIGYYVEDFGITSGDKNRTGSGFYIVGLEIVKTREKTCEDKL